MTLLLAQPPFTDPSVINVLLVQVLLVLNTFLAITSTLLYAP